MTETETGTTRILVVDDHPLVRAGIRLQLQNERGLEICGEAADIGDALRVLAEENPDLAIVDISLQTGNGLDLVQRMLAREPELKIIVSSMHDESIYAERALEMGASGFVHKQDAAMTLVRAIRDVLSGRLHASDEVKQRLLNRRVGRSHSAAERGIDSLSTRELDVFERIGKGQTVHEIAQQMKLSPKTVETHRDRIRLKLDIRSAHDLQHYAFSWVRDHMS